MCDPNSIYTHYGRIKAESEKEAVLFTQLCGSLVCDSLVIWVRTDISCDMAPEPCWWPVVTPIDATDIPLQPNREGLAAHRSCPSRNFSPRPLFGQQGRISNSIISGAYLTIYVGHVRRFPRNCTNGAPISSVAESGANTKTEDIHQSLDHAATGALPILAHHRNSLWGCVRCRS